MSSSAPLSHCRAGLSGHSRDRRIPLQATAVPGRCCRPCRREDSMMPSSSSAKPLESIDARGSRFLPRLEEGYRESPSRNGIDADRRTAFKGSQVSRRMATCHQPGSRLALLQVSCQAGSVKHPSQDAAPRRRSSLSGRARENCSSASLALAGDPTPSGKVGTVSFVGNSALASFGPAAVEARDVAEPPKSIGQTLCAMMPHLVVAAALAALTYPPSFTWFQKQYYPLALGGIMLSIGVQLSVDDFATVFKQPSQVVLGLALQYFLKPAMGILAVALFRVPPQFAAGLVLTSCVSGAQLASYATSLAGGSVALSVVLTSISTILSVAATPLLSKALIGAVIPVDAMAMAKSILQVVVAPICIGLVLNAKAKRQVDMARPYLPLLAIACTVSCIGSPLAYNQRTLVSWQGLALVLPVLFFHVACTVASYWGTKLPWIRTDDATSRTMALNGAMQSSTLAMLLASQFLGGSHPVPPSVSVVIMALLGLSLGSFWGKGGRLSDKAREVWHDLQEQMMVQRLEHVKAAAHP